MPADGVRRSDEPLRDELLLADLRGAPVVGLLDGALDRLPGGLVRRAPAAPRASSSPSPSRWRAAALAHAALKDTLEALRRRDGQRAADAGHAGARARAAGRRAFGARGRASAVGRARAPRRASAARLRADLERYLAHAAEADSPLEPSELELGFGFDGSDDRGEASTLPALELGGGFKLRGRIDRIDVGESWRGGRL